MHHLSSNSQDLIFCFILLYIMSHQGNEWLKKFFNTTQSHKNTERYLNLWHLFIHLFIGSLHFISRWARWARWQWKALNEHFLRKHKKYLKGHKSGQCQPKGQIGHFSPYQLSRREYSGGKKYLYNKKNSRPVGSQSFSLTTMTKAERITWNFRYLQEHQLCMPRTQH